MLVFWRLGYERATLTDLTEAMGINRPSLYAAFGDKQNLFRKALNHYAEGPAGYATDALSQPTARKVAEALLYGAAKQQTHPDLPRGCLAVLGAASNADDDPSSIGCTLIEARLAGETALRERFERARAEGDLPADSDPTQLAGYIRTILYGMAVKAASGATHQELTRDIEMAMRAWP
jgi:AcrR family transcriptional regulator